MKNKNIKICFTASSGGHLEEISNLRMIQKKYDNFLITEKIKDIDEIKFAKRKYFVTQINRKEILFLFKFVCLFFKSFKILRKEKPDYVITTGALCTYPVCIIAKVLGAKIVYIESFARCDSISLTGKLMRKKADMFIVQWEEMINIIPEAIYVGGIF